MTESASHPVSNDQAESVTYRREKELTLKCGSQQPLDLVANGNARGIRKRARLALEHSGFEVGCEVRPQDKATLSRKQRFREATMAVCK